MSCAGRDLRFDLFEAPPQGRRPRSEGQPARDEQQDVIVKSGLNNLYCGFCQNDFIL